MITIANGTILKGSNITPSKENIVIDNGKIIEISKDVLEGEIIDITGCIVSPSFLNAHTHIGDSIIKDEGDGLSLSEMVKPPYGLKHQALNSVEDDTIISAMKDSMNLMLESGTTHFIDYREGGIEGVKLLKKAASNMPIDPIILGRDNSFYGNDPDLKKVKINLRKLLKVADGVGLSGFDEVSDEVMNIVTNECEKLNKISSIHVAESKNANKNSLNKTNKTELKRAVDFKFNQIVHLTYPNCPGDFEELLKSNTSLTLCPRANATLNLAIFPFSHLYHGINPLLGSDNVMLNSPNILRDLEYTLKVMRAYCQKYVSPERVLKFATTNGSLSSDNSNQYPLLSKIKKSVIDVGQVPQLVISKKLSKNPYLSLINRCETKIYYI